MYTAGLNPFYASNFSLWSAYCAGGFAVDSMKKPSFCIADILQAGDAESLPPGSSALMVHMGHRAAHHHHQHHQQQQQSSSASPLRPSPVAPEAASMFGARLTSGLSRTFNPPSQQHAPPPSSKDLKFGIDRILSKDFDPKHKEPTSLRDLTSIVSSHRQSGIHQGSGQPAAGPYFSPLDPGMTDASSMMSALGGRQSGPHQFQDTFPGPYAVLTKDTMPQTYKRKRSWSRAVFSNLQRKGLEKRFEIQKYVTKPDRKQLAAMLGLTDAQVKVWFQNRRMKWRHSKEAQAQKDKEKEQPCDKSPAGGLAGGEEGEEEGEAKEPEESECDMSEPSESEFEEGDKSDVDICDERHKTSVIIPIGPVSSEETAPREAVGAPREAVGAPREAVGAPREAVKTSQQLG
ncbi:hypothetical protein NHX12_026477 [Muraenolepis orangiensis]|uniref:H2.0-like homeobox protein n=1 Tax=Muraenolepis orangiensis TaxID=630683 RepID=A0A9Q0EJL2_9TELE|nr:hypothetical protein NHX12_026477 [Muraenolepis orangiensis]